MRVENVKSNNYNFQPAFGRVIKTRFFEVLPNNTAAQIQDQELIRSLCKRLTYHLGCVYRNRKDRVHDLPALLSKMDSDYAYEPSIRRIFNFNRPYDNCVYLITGHDAVSLEHSARAAAGQKKNSQIIENHWKLVRNSSKRLCDEKKEELALNVFLRKDKHPKTQEDCFLFRTAQFIQERFMHFPYRFRGANLQ